MPGVSSATSPGWSSALTMSRRIGARNGPSRTHFGRVFVGRDGQPMRGDAIRLVFTRARRKVGMPGFRFHDLRHTGQTLAASAGATTKDLMRRLGHASPAAANRYLHAVDGRDVQIAAALSELVVHGDAARLPKSITLKH